VYSVELIDATNAFVRLFVSRATTNLATGTAIGSGFANPDNLATGANGEIYIIEDNNPGDIFAAYDADGDGVAESVGRFASLGVAGSEPTGFIYDPVNEQFLVCIQHPSSDNDAIWIIDAGDSDSDQILDIADVCIPSDINPTVVVKGIVDSGVDNTLYKNGCTLADLVNGLAAVAENHGEFVEAVAHLAQELLPINSWGKLANAAARAE
jgi:hypothetical protein